MQSNFFPQDFNFWFLRHLLKCEYQNNVDKLTYMSKSEEIEIILLKVKNDMLLTCYINTFLKGHFLFVKCKLNGKNPEIVSVDLYQCLCSSSGTNHGKGPISAYIPVEVTLLTMSSYSSQSPAITNLRDISLQFGSDDAAKICLQRSPPGIQNGVMSLLIKSAAVSTGSSYVGLKRTVKQLQRRKWRMNPPNTAQIVNTRLLVRVLPSQSLLSLSVTLGILNLKI